MWPTFLAAEGRRFRRSSSVSSELADSAPHGNGNEPYRDNKQQTSLKRGEKKTFISL